MSGGDEGSSLCHLTFLYWRCPVQQFAFLSPLESQSAGRKTLSEEEIVNGGDDRSVDSVALYSLSTVRHVNPSKLLTTALAVLIALLNPREINREIHSHLFFQCDSLTL